jgi:hypothetical protein
MRRIAFAAAVVFLLPAPVVYALYEVSNEGTWPKTWPKELESLRAQAKTLVGPEVLQSHYLIPFTDLEQFEAAWPYLLKVKTKGAPIILVRGPKTDFFEIKPAGVIVRSPPAGQNNNSATPETQIAGVENVRERWMNTTYFELVVDGKIVDLNRIPLPEDSPIIDERFKDRQEKPVIEGGGNGNAKPALGASKSLDAPILEGSNAGDRKELAPGIAFRWCPAGTFRMGEGDGAVDVELSKGFWLGETEVTQGQWKNLMGTSPWSGRVGVGARASNDTTPPKEGPEYAASYVNFEDAVTFCKKLTAQEQRAGRLPKNWNYSLPTEAQWEYACRAGTPTKFSFGDDESRLRQYAWFGDNSGKAPYARRVELKKPNE